MKDYNDKFARTIKILPAFGNHIAVDLQHNILQLWTLAIIMVMFITLKKVFRAWKLEQMHNTSAGSVDRING
ncbi:MAG: hypothetical protein WBZ33_13655 [Thermoactinomyces sp.]